MGKLEDGHIAGIEIETDIGAAHFIKEMFHFQGAEEKAVPDKFHR